MNRECDIMRSGFTAMFRVDLGGADEDEPLFRAGPLLLSIRMAGMAENLADYDRDAGNYLNFPLVDGSCPVVEAVMCGLRVGVPIGLLDQASGVHDIIVNLADTHFSISVDGHIDDDMFGIPVLEADLSARETLSRRVVSATVAIPADAGVLGAIPDSRPLGGNVQYWTPDGHNAWVGDVAPCAFGGRLHVFYLFDRRHHGSKRGAGGHWFAHISSSDLVHWDEHPPAVPLDEWWTSIGTGTPFEKDGRLCLAYGLHTDRIVKDGSRPMGGTYAVAEDGIHFKKTMRIVTDAQNPSIYNLKDGGYELVTSYGGTKGIFRSGDLENWTLYDGNLPFRGDCPSLFDWHGHRYLLQGFTKMAYSPDGSPGSFEDWSAMPDAAYDGLSVPMVAPWRDDRRLYIGWLRHPAGWGGWLVFRELIAFPDGHIGMKWVPEIKPPVPATEFHVDAGRKFECRFVRDGGGPDLLLTVDPEKREASFADDVPEPVWEPPSKAENFRIGRLRHMDGPYGVKVVAWHDRKADATIFDAEIGGERTLICQRRGKYTMEPVKDAAPAHRNGIRRACGLVAGALLALSVSATHAADYDYEVQYVKSAHGSCVKTDLVPQPGMTFEMAVRFDGPFNPMFGGKFDLERNTKAFFGEEDEEVDGVRNIYKLELGGNETQAYTGFAGFGSKSRDGKWTHCVVKDLNATIVDDRVKFLYDGKDFEWGWFIYNLDGERTATGKNPVSFFGVTRPDGSVRSYACYDMSLYGATFYKDGKRIARFIPVVKGGVAGLYEEVSKKFYASVTDAPLQAGPLKKMPAADASGAGGQISDFSIPIFEDDFTNPQVFAERWSFRGHAQKDIEIKDGAVRIPSSGTGDGIQWRGELPDEFAAEAEIVCYPKWSKIKDPKDGDYHWAVMTGDYGTFGVRSDGYGVSLYQPVADQPTRSCYPWIANFREQEPVTVRFERRRIGGTMMEYTYYVNGVKMNAYAAPIPKKKVGIDGTTHWNPLGIENFKCPFEVRRVTIYALKGEDSPNLISNSGFEFASDGVPPGWCNRNSFNAGKASVQDYKEKYLRCFTVDEGEKHSGKQSLRLNIGPFVRNFDFFAWNAPTEKGRSAVLSVWAKASEPGVKFKLKLSDDAKVVDLTTDWTRYEITTTNMPAPGIFSPVWFEVPELAKRETEASIWLDDVQLEMMPWRHTKATAVFSNLAHFGGFDPGKTYATEYKPKAGDAATYAPPKDVPHPSPDRKAYLSPAENALCGYGGLWPIKGLILGHYDFYMDEPKAEFRVWDDMIHAHGLEDPVFEEVAIDISALQPGTHEVTVRALGKDWKTTVVKRPYKKGATQVNQWSRTLVHDGKPVFMSAPCLIGRENAPKKDGSSTQIDILAEAGFKYLNLQNNLNVRDIEMNRQTLAYAAKKGMKFMLWTGEGELREVGDILRWEDNKPTDWSRQKMYDMLDSDDVLTVLVLDEPEYRKAADCQAYMKREKARFPYKPVQMNNSWLGISGRFAGLPTDILMIDYYLTTDGTTLDMVVAKVDVLRSIAPGKPCWYFMESENSLHPRIPSYKEQVAQCWGAVAAGATGLSWFVNMPTSRGCYDALVDINRELLDNTDFLCSDELCGGAVTSETTDYIRCLTRKHGDEWRIYTVNINPHPNAKVTFMLPADIPQDATVEVMYENRTLKAANGVFADSFDGFSRHIYRIVR